MSIDTNIIFTIGLSFNPLRKNLKSLKIDNLIIKKIKILIKTSKSIIHY